MASEREFNYGGIADLQGWTEQFAYSTITVPSGRAAADGTTPILVTALRGIVSGRDGSKNITLSLGSAVTPSFTVDAQLNNATGSRMVTCNPTLMAGGSSQRITFRSSNGTFWFGRGTSGTTTDNRGSVLPGALGGSFLYSQVPAAPVGVSVEMSKTASGQLDIVLPTGTDDGGSSITGYRVFISKNSTALAAGQYESYRDIPGSLRQTLDGLPLGTTHFFRFAAKNRVTTAMGSNSTGQWSSVSSATPYGLPSAPRNLIANKSTDAVNSVVLTWTAPEQNGGGISEYQIFANNALIGSTSDIRYYATKLDPNVRYSFTVRAVNAFTRGSGQAGPASNAASTNPSGTPSAPLNVQARTSSVTGRVTVSWTAPVEQSDGIVRYTVYYGNGAYAADVSESEFSANIDNLTPGLSYTFMVRAWNAVGVAANTPGPPSSSARAVAGGTRPPVDVTNGLSAYASSTVSGRVIVSWTSSTQANSYTLISVNGTLPYGDILTTKQTSVVLDNLTPGVAESFTLRINYKSLMPLPPRRPAVTVVPQDLNVQTLENVPVQNITNKYYNGTFNVSIVSGTSFSYVKNSPSQAKNPVSGFPAENLTNSDPAVGLNGTYTIESTPSNTTLTYARNSVPFIPGNTAVGAARVENTTNVKFNTLPNSPVPIQDVDALNGTITYNNPASGVITSRPSPAGTVTNTTNTVFNGTDIAVTAVTRNTVSYSKTFRDVPESSATGTITDKTNRDVYNGVYAVSAIPTYDSVQYVRDPDAYAGERSNLVLNPRFDMSSGATTVRQNYATSPRGLGRIASYYGDESQTITPGIVLPLSAPVEVGTAHRISYTKDSILPGVTLASNLPKGTYTVSAYVMHESGSIESKAGFGSINVVSERRHTLGTFGSWYKTVWTADIPEGGSIGYRLPTVLGDGSFLITQALVERGVEILDYFDGGDNTPPTSWSNKADESISIFSSPTPSKINVNAYASNFVGAEASGDKFWQSDIVDPVRFSLTVKTAPTTADTHTIIVRMRANRAGVSLSPVVRGTLGASFEVGTDWQWRRFVVRRNTSVPTSDQIGFVPYGTDWKEKDFVQISSLALIEGEYMGEFFDGDTSDTLVSDFSWVSLGNGDRYGVQTFKNSDGEILPPYGDTLRVSSQANLRVLYRSGWSG